MPIDIICENGHLELLEYYVPLYLRGLDVLNETDNRNFSEIEELSVFIV